MGRRHRVALLAGTTGAPLFTTRPELVGTVGMVASTHWLASAAGMAVLERGGNAFDAAVTAGFVLQVVEPHLNGPGGEAPMVLYDRRRDAVEVVDGQGVSPAAATIEAFRDLDLELVPGTGLLAATVPGALGAWLLVLERYGTWRLADVLEPAVAYAADGYPLLAYTARTIDTVRQLFAEEWTDSAAVYLTGGRAPQPGSRFRNPGLAHTYRRLVAEGEAAGANREQQIVAARDAVYRGFVADAIGSFCSGSEVMDTSGRRHTGLLTADDLALWQPRIEAPATFDVGDYTVCKTGPWGQGPVFLQHLALLADLDLRGMGFLSADHIHTVVESAKLAFADREAWYGDPRVVDVPLAALLKPSYGRERAALVGDAASFQLRPGNPDGLLPLLPPYAIAGHPAVAAAASGAGEPTVLSTGETRGDTCHVDVVDAAGNMVSATPSGGWLQGSPMIPDLGFCLGTRAQMFWLQPGLPSSLAPRKRPRTTLSPSLALRQGRPYLAFGTPGGDQQDQWSLNFFLAHTVFGLNLQQAIDAPTFHTTHFPSSFYPREAQPGHVVVEGRLDPGVVAELRRRGHLVDVADDWSLGRLSAVAQDRPGGFLRAGANPRGMQGYAVGR